MNMTTNFTIAEAVLTDIGEFIEIFLAHLTAHPEYISHGEVQMGVGKIKVEDGKISASLSEEAEKMWEQYIIEKITSEGEAQVYKAVSDEDGETLGFCVADIEEDGAEPFGMVCDVLVKENVRSQGIGNALLESAVKWLRDQKITDIYLESGLNNIAAHSFFRKRGFVQISEIYKLM